MNQSRENTQQIKGVLHHSKGQDSYKLQRRFPSKELAVFVEQYWHVSWDLRGQQPHIQQNIPHPSVNLVFEKNLSRIVGPVSKTYQYRMCGRGQIFAVKFQPGGFYPFYNRPIAELTDKTLALTSIPDIFSSVPNTSLESETNIDSAIDIIEAWLNRFTIQPPAFLPKLIEIINVIAADQDIVKTEHLCQRFNLSERKLQREFRRLLGLTPKWVIKKYRMHEALNSLEKDQSNLQALVFKLGYFDQAHFIRDFKAITGLTPGKYLKNNR